MPTIVVLVKNVPDTWSEKSLEADYTLLRDSSDSSVDNVIDEVNQYAVEQALRIKESDPEAGYRVVVLSAGPEDADRALRTALAMGADDALHLCDERMAGSDVLGTAWALTSAIRTIEDVQLVITGAASSDGATGAVPGIIAEYLPAAALTHLKSVSVSGGVVRGVRETSAGQWELEADLPAVISVGEQADKPRYPNFKGLAAAKKATITRLQLENIGVLENQVGLAHAATAVTAADTRESRGTGTIVRDNDPAVTAAAIADFLDERSLLK